MKAEDERKHEELVEAVRKVQDARTGIVLSGRINNGKVELDQSTLDEIARKFAGSNRSFVAVNAPFDPESSTIAELK